MTAVRNRPTAEGRLLGSHLARLTDRAKAELREKLGPEVAERLLPDSCQSCAFRAGTFPNGCPETVLDALKCVMEGVPFYCHQSEPNGKGGHTGLCRGYLTARAGLVGKAPLSTRWPFSHDMTPSQPTNSHPTEDL